MHWKAKAAIQRVLSVAPCGSDLNHVLQLLVRRSLGIDEPGFLFRARLANEHLATALEYLRCPVDAVTVYEFGAGSDLVAPLVRAARGVQRQIVVDQDILLWPHLIADVLRKLARHGEALGLEPLPQLVARSRRRLIRELKAKVGIDYRAPYDARATDLAADSIDLIASNSTLEHVPCEQLDPLLGACRRVLRNSGIACFRIDYEDHYAILDHDVSPYNFLGFSEREWSAFNSKLQFQNRLRHCDFVELFQRAGFELIHVETLEPSARALAELSGMRVAAPFRSYSVADLGTRKGTFVMRKA